MVHSPLRVVIIKTAARCNLACSYCYVYTKGDESWRSRPGIMSDRTFRDTLEWIRRQIGDAPQTAVTLLFHGGEPLLIGPDRLDRWCREARDLLGENNIGFAIQTNGVLIDERWVDLFRRHRISIGVSLDGPEEANDATRIDHQGRGSYARVRAGIRHLQDGGLSWAVLTVIDFDQAPLAVHRHLIDEVGATHVDYLFPDQTHDTIGAVRERHGATPLADWLIPVFDDWWARDSIRLRIRTFDAMVGALLRGGSTLGQFGNPPLGYLIVESDGSIEGLDVLKICEPGLAQTGLTVRSGLPVRSALPPFHRKAIFEGTPLPHACGDCPEAGTCGGGWLPHRFAQANGFDNPSAWCADLLKLFDHLRARVRPPPGPAAAPRVLVEDRF